ncbi:transcriptional repressor [Rhodoferax saidenbachensis]|uniref:Uncharacterized protein n=1 Tax=Rhodoferax saidenbachensis TaxID=1484693 RepID=A0ABU1ZLU6_9BURK|nr:transcriptional repressor [Rhodoferax saidenbachensis]MDR7306509.1 hypothetical protein [Rhodoferax saidenbachensis]
MKLRATVLASSSDNGYDGMAYIYCHDPELNYCFSLTRSPDSEDVEVMVVDQRVRRVLGLRLELSKEGFVAHLEPSIAAELDGHTEYEIEFLSTPQGVGLVEAALQTIFREKDGLVVNCL